eukprot:1882623-Pleurochrysis_carterae.AAC.1
MAGGAGRKGNKQSRDKGMKGETRQVDEDPDQHTTCTHSRLRGTGNALPTAVERASIGGAPRAQSRREAQTRGATHHARSSCTRRALACAPCPASPPTCSRGAAWPPPAGRGAEPGAKR